MFNTTPSTSDLKARTQATIESVVLVVSTFVFASLFGAILLGVVQGLGIVSSETSFGGRLLNIFILQGLSFPLLMYTYLELTNRSIAFFDIDWPTPTEIGIAVGGTLLLVGMNYALNIIFQLVETTPAPSTFTQLAAPEYYLVLGVLSLVVVAPMEEALFRGVIQKHLAEVFSTTSAVILAGAIFSLPHYQALLGNTGQLPSLALIFVLGCVLGAVYAYTENLTVPIIMHGVFNAIVFVANYLSAV